MSKTHTHTHDRTPVCLALSAVLLSTLASLSHGQEEPGELTVTAETTLLIVGQASAMTVMDGDANDLTDSSTGTLYESSNPGIVHVTTEGLVTAIGVGTSTVSVINGDVDDMGRPILVGELAFLVGIAGDQDADGLPDDYEAEHGLDPLDPGDAGLDPDQDGLPSEDEFARGTDPMNPDTDGDGASDGGEVIDGSDPLQFDLFLLLDGSWALSVNGQAVQANEDGRFVIRNVSAADRFGPGGPGTAPDFLSDDFNRLVGTQTSGGVTRWVFSEPFQIARGQTFRVGNIRRLTFTETPPPLPESIRIELPQTVLMVGEATQAVVTAELMDGSQQDVSERTSWTTYLTSNTAVATVEENGLVTTHAPGDVLITALNEGAASVVRLVVTTQALTTDVEGYVQLEDGTAVEGAAVSTGFGGMTTSAAGGFFRIDALVVPVEASSLTTVASALVGGEQFTGSSTVELMPGLVTDAGIVVLTPRPALLIVATDASFPIPTAQLQATGLFESIDTFVSGSATPTLDLLDDYGVVLCYTNVPPFNPTLLGDVLADYVDGGGRVVLGTYSFSSPWAVFGRITSPGYAPLVNVGVNADVSRPLVEVLPEDPLLQGIDLGNMAFFSNSNYSRPALDGGAVLIATDAVGTNMIARNAAGNVVGLNFFPGVIGTNGSEFFQLVANALRSTTSNPGGIPLTARPSGVRAVRPMPGAGTAPAAAAPR